MHLDKLLLGHVESYAMRDSVTVGVCVCVTVRPSLPLSTRRFKCDSPCRTFFYRGINVNDMNHVIVPITAALRHVCTDGLRNTLVFARPRCYSVTKRCS